MPSTCTGYRQQYAAEVMSNRLAHKRSRIDILLNQFNAISDGAGGEEKACRSVVHRREMRDILAQVRDEMDENKTQFNTLIYSQVQNYSDTQLQDRLKEVVNKLKGLGNQTLIVAPVQASEKPSTPQPLQDPLAEDILRDGDTMAQLREKGNGNA